MLLLASFLEATLDGNEIFLAHFMYLRVFTFLQFLNGDAKLYHKHIIDLPVSFRKFTANFLKKTKIRDKFKAGYNPFLVGLHF